MISLKGKKIAVTGASSGIGREVAVLASSLGAELVLTGRNKKNLDETVSLLEGNNHIFFCGDLSTEKGVEAFVEFCPEINGIVHSAGIVLPVPLKFIKQKHLQEVFSINTFSSILITTNLVAKNKIKNKSSLVFISSVSTSHPYFGGSIYVASKAALEAFSKNAALELSNKQIRSNVVSPALVKTNIFTETMKSSSEEELKKYELQYPLGFGETTDVASAIVFFLSDSSKWITGQNITLDGGLTLSSKK